MAPVNKFETTEQFATPLIGDVLLFESRDSKAAPNTKAPVYGTPHWNTVKWPHHELVYISPIDQNGKRQYVYAAKRDHQDLYNYEITYPYGGLRENPRYTRSYVIKRSEYTPITNGASDPVLGASTVLISEVEARIGIQELDSLYVAVNRVYDTIPVASAQTGFGYTVSYPFQDDAYPRITWRFSIRRSTYTPAAELSACPIPGYTSLKLTEQPTAESGLSENQIIVVTRVYDTLPGPPLVTEILERDTKVPPQFVVSAEITSTRTRLEAPTANPDPLTGDIESSEVTPEGKATASRVTITYLEQSTSPLDGSDIDPETGKSFEYETKHVPAGTTSLTPVDANGVGIIVTPLNTYWSIQTVRKIVGLAGNPRTYQGSYNYYWPKVVFSINVNDIRDRDGNLQKVTTWVSGRDAYKGPCLATFTDSWSLVAPTVTIPVQMVPKPMQWDLVFTGDSIEESLHPGLFIEETSGTSHPDYAYFINRAVFPATNYTDWPASVVAVDQITPHYGGFLRTTIEVFRPPID